ncbi:hypothetical protein NBRC116583_06910 [Arenicella sp. 4NH20-0111]|uniref:barstar family protein n=1 Tax=Arenicella sp. 4NH20-0111 TaxID=3127648 RepID=UPI003106D721
MTNTYVLNANDFSNLIEFYDLIGELLLPDEFWGKNLDALNDILSGGFNIPDSPFEIVWENIEKSKNDLGARETIIWYEAKLFTQEDNRQYIRNQIAELRSHKGDTLFDFIYDVLSENSSEILVEPNRATFKM